jgi:hypothetical protein
MMLPLAAEPAATTPALEPAPPGEELAALRQENAALRTENAAVRAESAVLHERVRELEARLGHNSTNSSRPPSSDPPHAPARPKAPPSGRKRGTQPGHRGMHRALLPVEQVDEIVAVVPERCRHCEQPLPEPTGGRRGRVWRHQVVELLPLTVRVAEYQMAARRCARCGKHTRADLPAGVPRRPFGARLTAGEFGRDELQRRLIPLQARLGRLRRRGEASPDPKAPALWTFARVEGVEPTNNAAERALRPAGLWRTGSFGADSEAGSHFAERLLTVVASCRQQGRRCWPSG